MGLRRNRYTPLNINIKWGMIGVSLLVATAFIAPFSGVGAVCCFLFGISSVLRSIERDITHRVGFYFLEVALVVLGIVLGLFLCR